MRLWSSRWRIPSASVCGDSATSRTSATGAAGTPAAVRRSCQAAVSSVARRSASSVARASRFPTRSAFVRKRGSSTRSGTPSDGAEGPEEPVVAGGHHQRPVACREHLVRRDHREPRPVAPRHRPVGEVADEVVAEVADRGLVEGDVDHRALAGALAVEQGGEDADRRPRARALVDRRRPDTHAGAARLPGHRDQPARGLHQGVVARLARERARRGRTRRPSSRRGAGSARAAPPARAPAPPRGPGAGSGGRRRLGRRVEGAPRGRAGRGATARASASRRWRRGTSRPRPPRTAVPTPARRPRCRAARP